MINLNIFKINIHDIKTMLTKKRCPRCEEKIKSKYEYCPNCGLKIGKSKKIYGMLGKNDFMESEQLPMLGGLSGGLLNKMVGNAMKMLEKEIQKSSQENVKHPQTKIRLMINGKEITPMINSQQPQKQKENIPTKVLPINFSAESLKKFKKLNKKEPKTQVRRFGDKLTYELEVPGVESIKDISIIKIEKGIEVKAIAKNKAYEKTISIDLPLLKYVLSEGKISLELDVKG